MKYLLFFSLCLIVFLYACKKNSTDDNNSCNQLCQIQSGKWNIEYETIFTDMGSYTYTKDQLSGIEWSYFIFNSNYTYQNNDPAENGAPYSYSAPVGNSDGTISLSDPTSTFKENFNIKAANSDSLQLNGEHITVHPALSDTSVAGKVEASLTMTALKNDFGVDTSKVQWIEPSFVYNH